MSEWIEAKLELLPTSPGCYLHKNKDGQIIYVGKAKNLRNRVRSYFRGSHNYKTDLLVSEIVDFDFIVTTSEVEALLLEINLIQENKPKYNILLKDGGSYPYIKITNERHPRLVISRQVKKGTGTYFGPYPDSRIAYKTLKILDRIYPFKKCKLPQNQYCLYYHFGQCLAHGEQMAKPEDYESMTREIGNFLNGKDDKVIDLLKKRMYRAADNWEYELAAEYRDLLEGISSLRTRQRVIAHDLKDRDVFGYTSDRGWMSVQLFFVRQGKLIKSNVQQFQHFNDPKEDFLTYLGQFYNSPKTILPKEVFLPEEVDLDSAKAIIPCKVVQPKKGEKKHLVTMAIKNASISLQQKFDLLEKEVIKNHTAIEDLGSSMGLDKLKRIEAFDNSNTMGADAVSTMVVFIDGKPSKKDFRKYKIKTVDGPDDYASMFEVISRRYKRVKEDGLPEPDLIIVDGGKGQVTSAIKALKEIGMAHIPVAGLLKNKKHQTHELLYGNPPQIVQLQKNSQEFFLLQRIQNEVHRFAITFHRQLRSKNSFSSQLDNIPGLGPKRKQILLTHFKSLTRLKQATLEEMTALGIPKSVALSILKI